MDSDGFRRIPAWFPLFLLLCFFFHELNEKNKTGKMERREWREDGIY